MASAPLQRDTHIACIKVNSILCVYLVLYRMVYYLILLPFAPLGLRRMTNMQRRRTCTRKRPHHPWGKLGKGRCSSKEKKVLKGKRGSSLTSYVCWNLPGWTMWPCARPVLSEQHQNVRPDLRHVRQDIQTHVWITQSPLYPAGHWVKMSDLSESLTRLHVVYVATCPCNFSHLPTSSWLDYIYRTPHHI